MSKKIKLKNILKSLILLSLSFIYFISCTLYVVATPPVEEKEEQSQTEQNQPEENLEDNYPTEENSTDQNITEPVFPVPPEGKIKADTLMLLYMDGDNNLNNSINSDKEEVINGYKLLKDSDKTEIVILFDGNSAETPYGDTVLYKSNKERGFININKDANWLHSTDNTGTKKEATMSDPKTLENFLKWAKSNYEYKNIILQISDHGAGPGSIPESSRAMCEDINKVNTDSQQYLIGTKDVPVAIKNSGIGKIDLVIQDVCLGGNIEEAYEYKDVADYMLLSPNLMSVEGLNYVKLVSHLTEGDCIHNGNLDVEEYLDKAVCDFISDYKLTDEKWDIIKNIVLSEDKDAKVDDPLSLSLEAVKIKPEYISTITAVRLKDIANLKTAIDNFVNLIPEKSILASYFKSFQNVFYNMNSYASPLGTLYDISYFADEVNKMSNPNILNTTLWNKVLQSSNEIKIAMDNVIVCSWRDGVGGALYNKSSMKELTGIAPFNSGSYGLAICGLGFKEEVGPDTKKTNVYGFIPGQYKENLSFGKESLWYDFLDNVLHGN